MSAHGWRIAAAACLMGLAAGCRSMLDVPASAKASGSTNQEARDGRLFDRLTGRKREAARPESSLAGEDSSGKVHFASHAQAESPGPGAAGASPAAASTFASDEEEDAGLTLSDFYFDNLDDTFKKLIGQGPNEEVARAHYQQGEDLFAQRQYKDAAGRFEKAAKRAPESPLQEDSLFMWGESLFFSDQYPKAYDAYSELLKEYEYTRHLDTAVARLFAIGRYWEQLDATEPARLLGLQLTDSSRPKAGTLTHALKAYHGVRMHDPTGPLADDSVMATANAHFLHGRYEDATYHYDLLRKEYPKSEHQLNAHLLGMKSKLESYQGPKYDGTQLKDAAEIADRTLAQFGNELGRERERVVQARDQILEKQAKRDQFLAEYYEKKKDYRAARYYYQLIIEEYPTTEAAEKARARLTEIADRPDKPTNYLSWLKNVLPSHAD
jgi:outer membrane protein assembly factor BamD (BamD/ComL family)